jgi:hypothetical protein
LLNDFLQSNIYAIHKYLAAILRTKNNMVLTGVENMTIGIFPILWGSARLRQLKIVSSQRD